MKVKLDENLPESLIPALSAIGHDVDSVRAERLVGSNDKVIWEATQAADRFLVTQDLDFSDVRRYAPGAHAGLLLVRLHAPSRRALHARIESLFRHEPVEQWARCFVVATDRKIRVRHA